MRPNDDRLVIIDLGGWGERARALAELWHGNWRIGWPERARGLHYWLGFEYAAALRAMESAPGQCWLDVGTGAWSPWPFLLADSRGAEVVALDVDPGLDRQRGRRQRAARAGLRGAEGVRLVRADARALPFATATFDGVTAVSTLEHVRDHDGDRRALQEIARVLRPGGQALVSVPFRWAGSIVELDDDLSLYQRHYSLETFERSMLAPSGLELAGYALYAERLPFYGLARHLPRALDWLRRPWDTVLTILLMRPATGPQRATAMLTDLRRPS